MFGEFKIIFSTRNWVNCAFFLCFQIFGLLMYYMFNKFECCKRKVKYIKHLMASDYMDEEEEKKIEMVRTQKKKDAK